MSDHQTTQHDEEELPEKVIAELRARLETQIAVPASVDQSVLSDARAVLEAVRPTRKKWRKQWTLGLVSVGSLAAALMIFVAPQLLQDAGPFNESPMLAETNTESEAAIEPAGNEALMLRLKQDIDGDGQVDILDAFALARHIGDESISVQDGDQNGDGILDNGDVDLIAMTAVML